MSLIRAECAAMIVGRLGSHQAAVHGVHLVESLGQTERNQFGPFLLGRGFFIEGLFAGVMYRSLRMLHEQALHGTPRALLGLLARALSRGAGPPVKLH